MDLPTQFLGPLLNGIKLHECFKLYRSDENRSGSKFSASGPQYFGSLCTPQIDTTIPDPAGNIRPDAANIVNIYGCCRLYLIRIFSIIFHYIGKSIYRGVRVPTRSLGPSQLKLRDGYLLDRRGSDARLPLRFRSQTIVALGKAI